MYSLPSGVMAVVKEAARHLLRRPVVGIAAAATAPDGRWLLIQRASGLWGLPGGTLEWGETCEQGLLRELDEEAGSKLLAISGISGVYSAPKRDSRFHAVTIVVRAEVALPHKPPMNPAEIREARLFSASDIPEPLAHGMSDMLANAIQGRVHFE